MNSIARVFGGFTRELNVLEVGDVPQLQKLSLTLDGAEQLCVRSVRVGDLATLAQRMEDRAWDVVVVAADQGGPDPVEVVRCIKSRRPKCLVVMIADVSRLEDVLNARKDGLDEYVVRTPSKDVFHRLLVDAMLRGLERRGDTGDAGFEPNSWPLFDGAPIGLDVLDMDGRILRTNPALEELLGYSSQELQGRMFSDFTVDEESHEAEGLVRGLVSGEITDYGHVSDQAQPYFTVERRFRRKDGSVRCANLIRLLIHDDEGLPRFVVGAMVDITDRKRTKLALRKSEALNQAILETTIDGIISIDEAGVVQTFNRAAEDMFGYSKEEIVGEKINVLMSSPDRERHDQYLQGYYRTGEPAIIGAGREVEGRRKDGTTFPLELGVGEARVDGRRVFTGVLRDLSEKKAMERQLHQSEKMQAVGQLAGGVAHDFNNVLMVVSSYSEVLKIEHGKSSGLASIVDKVQDAVSRGARLTRQLLDFSPERAGQVEVLNLNDVIIEMNKFLGHVIEADIAVELTLAADLGKIEADVGHVEQLLMNLVVNARDAMPSGGKLTIHTRDEEVGAERALLALRPGRYAVLEVEDTGIGMDEETQARIFEPFYTTKAQSNGTGLGLATVYGLAHRYDGYVSVDSEPGRGSRFTIYLPITETELRGEGLDEVLTDRRDQALEATVLLVEDENDIREPLRYSLENAGCTVLEASSGEEAVQIGREHSGRIDLLLSDVILSGMSGVELADTLREADPEIKTIFISGYAGDVLERKNLGPDRVLVTKPFGFDQLIEAMRTVLEG